MPSRAETPFSSISLITILLALIPFFLISAWMIVSALDYQDSDFFTFWLAGRMFIRGENPYNTVMWLEGHRLYGADWIANPIYPYPLPLVFFTFPLGLLPLKAAYILWIFISQVLITISIYFTATWDSTVRFKVLFLPFLAGAFLFRPTLVLLRNGQLSAFLFLILVLALYLWKRQKWWQGAGVVSLLVLKPTIGLPVIALILLWLLVQKRFLASGALFIALALLAMSGFLIDPSWVTKFLWFGRDKFADTFGYSPTVWGFSGIVCNMDNRCTMALGSLLTLGLLVVFLVAIIRRGKPLPPALMLGIVVPVSLLVTPYLWAYDQILLLLCVGVTVELFSRKEYPYLLVGSISILFALLSLIILYLANSVGHDGLGALLSFLPLLILWMYSSGRMIDPADNPSEKEQFQG